MMFIAAPQTMFRHLPVLMMVCLIAPVFAAGAAGSDIQLTARVDRNHVTVYDRIQYTLTVESSQRGTPDPIPPDFSGFKDSADVGRGMNSFHILKGSRFRFYLDKASGKFPVYHPVYFLNPPWVLGVGMTGFVFCKPVIPGHPDF